MKGWVISLVGSTRDAIHVYVGFFCLVASLTILRVPLTSYRSLAFGAAVSCLMEALDLRVQFVTGGPSRWAGSLHDLVNTNLIPFFLVILSRKGWVRA